MTVSGSTTVAAGANDLTLAQNNNLTGTVTVNGANVSVTNVAGGGLTLGADPIDVLWIRAIFRG